MSWVICNRDNILIMQFRIIRWLYTSGMIKMSSIIFLKSDTNFIQYKIKFIKMRNFFSAILLSTLLLVTISATAQNIRLSEEVRQTMLEATRFMVEEVSHNGGYLWQYLPDFSRRWGEMEAYETMIWIQDPGTVSMGHIYLDAYDATGDEYYYSAAENVAGALIWGQSNEGGWNYMVDFAGDRSLKKWYDTIGVNGWRLEEFQHYYGNATYDDEVTTDAGRFLLRMYLERLDPKFKPALDKAIQFVLDSQYPLGGWPQRYPLRYDNVKTQHYPKNGHIDKVKVPDYSSYYTYNDDVIWENIDFLIQCYYTLGQKRLLDPIRRGMNFYLVSLQASPQSGWGEQHDMELRPAQARTYEPKALSTGRTVTNAYNLMKFYEYTGDRNFLERIPDVIAWLEDVRLPEEMTGGGRHTHSTWIEVDTNKPLFVSRKGSNNKYGFYYYDYNDENLIGHYGQKRSIDLDRIKAEYARVSALSPEEATAHSPLKEESFSGEGTPQVYFNLSRYSSDEIPTNGRVREIIDALDDQNRWLVKNLNTTNPYIGEGQKKELTHEFATTHVGDETDTSPYRDTSDQGYISTREYIRNMNQLINFLLQ